MPITITEDAAKYLLGHLKPGDMPLRLTAESAKGCGDKKHRFTYSARRREGDETMEMHGITLYCDVDEHPEYEDASIELLKTPGSFGAHIVVIPLGGHLCGCGSTAVLPR